MELTILLAQVIGLYFIICGIGVWLRRRHFAPVLGAFAHDPLTRIVIATLEIIGGLFLVLTHNIWTSAAASIVSLTGWLLLLEGVFYMLASDRTVESMIKNFNKRAWYTFGGIGAIIVGLYLVAYGFGWLA